MLCWRQILGNGSEFRRAVGLTLAHLTFDRNTTVQVFEATIRYTIPSLTLALTLTLHHCADVRGYHQAQC